jgi:hypothetical protein
LNEFYPTWTPTIEESEASNKVVTDFLVAKEVSNKSYTQFNGRTLYEAIDDWSKRWNGFIPEASPLLDKDQSRIFLNFTRNQTISYLSKVALQKPKIKIKAVNKKSGSTDLKFAEALQDLNEYSLNEENGDARFLETSLEATIKGTAIVYEGYAKNTQITRIPVSFDTERGMGKFKKETRTVFDNCFQKIIPTEDFYIANPYQPDVQKQPFIVWKEVTTHEEASREFKDYKNWEFVKPGAYSSFSEPTTFYRNSIHTDLARNQVEILRYYTKSDKDGTRHIVMVNGVILYDGPIPFKDGNYPFAKGIFEPYDNFFFWGAGFPQKIMGDQDLVNTIWNMMVDKTYGSLLPYGLSSDLDDFVEDDILQPNKIRKVGDINKWVFNTLPGVNAGEQSMLQQAINFTKDNAGNVAGAGQQFSPQGGKLNVRQVLLQQQESMSRLGFSVTFLEDLERDRTLLRVNHILQFYSIPKIEKVAGGIEDLIYRDARLSGVKLSDGKTGDKMVKIIPHPNNEDERQNIADQLSVEEAKEELKGNNLEALAVDVDTFFDHNIAIQVVRNSSYEKNAALDQAARQEFATWRLGLFQLAPVDVEALIAWVQESFDIDADQFKPKGGQMNPMMQQQQMMQQGQQGPMQELAPTSMNTLSNNL